MSAPNYTTWIATLITADGGVHPPMALPYERPCARPPAVLEVPVLEQAYWMAEDDSPQATIRTRVYDLSDKDGWALTYRERVAAPDRRVDVFRRRAVKAEAELAKLRAELLALAEGG